MGSPGKDHGAPQPVCSVLVLLPPCRAVQDQARPHLHGPQGLGWGLLGLLKQGLAAALTFPIFQMRRLRLGEEQNRLELCSILQWGGAGPWPCLDGPRLRWAGREGLCWNCGWG